MRLSGTSSAVGNLGLEAKSLRTVGLRLANWPGSQLGQLVDGRLFFNPVVSPRHEISCRSDTWVVPVLASAHDTFPKSPRS